MDALSVLLDVQEEGPPWPLGRTLLRGEWYTGLFPCSVSGQEFQHASLKAVGSLGF